MPRKGKYDKEIVEKICLLIQTDSYTIAEICTQVGINQDTYFDWLKKKPEFSDAIKKAKGEFNDFLLAECKKSLVKKIQGYTVQEVKSVTVDTRKLDDDGNPIYKQKEKTVIDKHFQPDTAAIIFTLCNRDPDNWKNRIDNNLVGNIDINGSVPVKKWLKKNSK